MISSWVAVLSRVANATIRSSLAHQGDGEVSKVVGRKGAQRETLLAGVLHGEPFLGDSLQIVEGSVARAAVSNTSTTQPARSHALRQFRNACPAAAFEREARQGDPCHFPDLGQGEPLFEVDAGARLRADLVEDRPAALAIDQLAKAPGQLAPRIGVGTDGIAEGDPAPALDADT